MKLTYTIEVDLSEPLFGRQGPQAPEDVSAELMRLAFQQVEETVAGRRVQHLTIFPHEDSKPPVAPEGTETEGNVPDETCPTCGIPQYSRSAA